MKILLLGGTQEGKQLATRLADDQQIELTYSTRREVPSVSGYKTIYGGFGGAEKLAEKLSNEGFDLLLDMTYPYAAQMSQNAVLAAKISATPLCSFQRPRWVAQPGDEWYFFDSLAEIIPVLIPYQCCFFSMDAPYFQNSPTIPAHQQWFIRRIGLSEKTAEKNPQITFIEGRGPFSFEAELQQLTDLNIDALISFDSGGKAAKTKIEAAKAASIPVFFINRPATQLAERTFDNIDDIEQALTTA